MTVERHGVASPLVDRIAAALVPVIARCWYRPEAQTDAQQKQWLRQHAIELANAAATCLDLELIAEPPPYARPTTSRVVPDDAAAQGATPTEGDGS